MRISLQVPDLDTKLAEAFSDPTAVKRVHHSNGEYSLLATAVAGRPVRVLSHRGVTFSDGVDIHIDESSDVAVMSAVAVHSAMMAVGSLSAPFIRKLVARRRIADRYLAIEAVRAVTVHHSILPFQVVDAVTKGWGSTISSSPAESFKIAESGVAIPAAPKWLGRLLPRQLMKNASLTAGSEPNPEDLRPTRPQVELPEADDDDDSDEIKLFKAFQSPLVLKNPLFEMMRNQFGLGRRPGDAGQSADLPVGDVRRVTESGPNAKVADVVLDDVAAVIDSDDGQFLHPEWDVYRQEYRPQHCQVTEYEAPWRGETAESSPLVRMSPALCRSLLRVSRSLQWQRRQPEGQELDLDAVVSHLVARASGIQGPQDIYARTLRTRADLSVLIVQDASGSTGDIRRGATIFDTQRELALELASAFDRVGHESALVAFNTHGPADIRFISVKSFRERVDARVRARFAGLTPSGFTRMGAVIRHSTWTLRRHRAAKPVLVFLSDGLPYDDSYEDRYAEADTMKALEEASRSGVACVAIAVGEDSDQLARIFGPTAYLNLEKPSDVDRHLGRLLESALRSARRNGVSSTQRLAKPPSLTH
jgi:Mg-chelatase subunit ChlD